MYSSIEPRLYSPKSLSDFLRESTLDLDTLEYKKSTDILKSHEDKLHAVAAVLMEKEKIDGDEFTEIMK